MRLDTLHTEGLGEPETIDELRASLRDSTLVVFTVKTTASQMWEQHSQVVNITAVALDANTGARVGSFHKEAELAVPIFNEMQRQDQLKRSGAIESDVITIRDMLDLADYDLAGSHQLSEAELIFKFKGFVESFTRPILVTYGAAEAMRHLDAALPAGRFRPERVVDVRRLAEQYLIPILKDMYISGIKKAAEMLSKLREVGGMVGLGRALGVPRPRGYQSLTIIEVHHLVEILRGLLKFVATRQERIARGRRLHVPQAWPKPDRREEEPEERPERPIEQPEEEFELEQLGGAD